MKHIIYADLDAIVFEGREQSYGAYNMRSKYNRILIRSTLMAFLLFLFVTGLPKVIDWVMPDDIEIVEPPVDDLGPILELPPKLENKIEDEPPIPPKIEAPKPQPKIATIAFARVEPDPDPDPEVSLIDMDSLLDVDTVAIGNRDVDGKGFDGTENINWDDLIGDGTGDPVEVGTNEKKEPLPGDFFIGEEPKPINMDEFKRIVGYPAMAKEAGIEGKVTVRVLVDELGFYKKHIVLKDPHAILTRRVEKKLNALRFTPGIQGKEPVQVWVTIPVDFVLSQ